MTQGHRLLVKPSSHQVVAVAGGAVHGMNDWKGPKRTLRHRRQTRWDRTSFYKIDLSIRRHSLQHVYCHGSYKYSFKADELL